MLQKIKSFLFNFFHFNKQERNGVFILLIILITLLIIKLLLPYVLKNNSKISFDNITLKTQKNTADTISFKTKSIFINEKKTNYSKIKKELFIFDPNTITLQEGLKLGLSKKLISTLDNFRNKGGKFYKPSDLKKLYGLSENQYKELESYILITDNKQEAKTFNKPKTFSEKNEKHITELNSADSLQILNIKGIGPAFTKRIIKYRNMLGGFHTINQLKDIYGMTDSLFLIITPQIQIDKSKISTIPINSIDLNSLRKHPYLNFQTAQAIYNYRFKHGKLTEKDIIELGIFNKEKLNLILPYFTY